MQDHFKMFAAYNGWANRRLYTAAAGLSEEQWQRDCRIFFGSMCATLNHILVADMIWMRRFTGEGEAPDRLDAVLHEAFDPLLSARREMDERIMNFCNGLSDARLAAEFTYTPVSDPTPVTQRLAPTLAHFFNHQTHHRGQAHALLSQLTGDAPPLDLIYYQREARSGPA